MNSPDDDSALESLIRARAGRLAKPDPAWRETILAACEAATTAGSTVSPSAAASDSVVPSRSSRSPDGNRAPLHPRPWLTFPRAAAWGSLAACWLAVLMLNQEARQLTASRTHPASGPSGAIPGPPPAGALFLQPADLAMLSLIQAPGSPRRAPLPPPAETKVPPRHSFHCPTSRHPLLHVLV